MGSVFVPLRAARACGGGVVTTGADRDARRRRAAHLHLRPRRPDRRDHADWRTRDHRGLRRGDLGAHHSQRSTPPPVKQAELDTLVFVPPNRASSRRAAAVTTASAAAARSAAGSDKGGAGAAPGGRAGQQPGGDWPRHGGDADRGQRRRDQRLARPTTASPIPAAERPPVVDAYAGPGRYFIAIRRNDTAATGGATSVGVHFTLAGRRARSPAAVRAHRRRPAGGLHGPGGEQTPPWRRPRRSPR